jgi:E3 ubiquitin-protein ligase HECTD3
VNIRWIFHTLTLFSNIRWSLRHDQWWECKFIAEGIIDQGGGFRDSLSDIAEELCPSDNTSPVPLPFFIRSPNQVSLLSKDLISGLLVKMLLQNNVDANVNRDVYISNPSCQEYHHYEWIGKLMGACLRGKENLVRNRRIHEMLFQCIKHTFRC